MKDSIKAGIANSYSYAAYRNLVTSLLQEGKSTGNEQSEEITQYSQLNDTRMNRLDKTIVVAATVKQQLQQLETPYIWLVLAEGWCGDAAQILPVLNKMALESERINLRIVLRDENTALMDLFLTNGARSIPKLIVVEPETFEVLGAWGPRPSEAIMLIKEYKEKHGVIDETIKTDLQKWYLQDKGLSTQHEVMAIMASDAVTVSKN